MFQTIDQVYDYIYSFINLENRIEKRHRNKEYSLDNMYRVASLFDNPHEGLKVIHIAGTKGKGSTAIMLTGLLEKAGHSVLTFLSPHLIDPNERILYNRTPISDRELTEIVTFIKEKLDSPGNRRTGEEGARIIPTTFELLFLIALLYGRKKKCDYYVLETGLGGRFDCTNIVDPLVSVITSIGYDHMNILGDTIKKIAFEKAGIIKKGRPVVTAPQIYDVVEVFEEKARKSSAPFYYIPRILTTGKSTLTARGSEFVLQFKELKELEKHGPLKIGLEVFGEHQIENFCTAYYAALQIEPALEGLLQKEPLFRAALPGRIQLIREEPPVILDVSHTAESARELVKTLDRHFPRVRWHLLSAMADDKNVTAFYKILSGITEKLVMTPLSEYKQSDTESIYQKVSSFFPHASYSGDMREAAAELLKSGKPLLITGSFYIAGPFLDFFTKLCKNNISTNK